MKKIIFYKIACLFICFNVIILSANAQKKSKKASEEEFVFVEVMPEFPGGQEKLMEFLGQQIIYPTAAVADSIVGKMEVSFVVNEDGALTDINILRNLNKYQDLFEEEIRRVFALMPSWQPGTVKGKPVKIRYSIPVVFSLEN